MKDKDYAKIFSENLKYYMEKNGKTQADIRNDLGFDKSMVSCWVRGVHIPRMDKLDKLANYLGCGRDALMGWKKYDYTNEYKAVVDYLTTTQNGKQFIEHYSNLNEEYRQRVLEVMKFYLQEQEKERS